MLMILLFFYLNYSFIWYIHRNKWTISDKIKKFFDYMDIKTIVKNVIKSKNVQNGLNEQSIIYIKKSNREKKYYMPLLDIQIYYF